MQQTIAITNINLFIVVKLPIIKINPLATLYTIWQIYRVQRFLRMDA